VARRRQAEHQHVLKRRQRLAHEKLQSGRCGGFDHRLGVDPLIRGGARTAAAGVVVDDADAPLRPQRFRRVPQERHRIFDFAIRVGDEDGIDAARQVRIGFAAEHGPHVPQVFALGPAFDRVDHRRLDVFGVNEAVGADAAREANREPAAGRADFRDDRSVRDVQHVHDLIGLLPLITIRRFQEPQVHRREEAGL
jgi:hypothetical protein